MKLTSEIHMEKVLTEYINSLEEFLTLVDQGKKGFESKEKLKEAEKLLLPLMLKTESKKKEWSKTVDKLSQAEKIIYKNNPTIVQLTEKLKQLINKMKKEI